jgi:hypothetical protein
MDASRFFSKSYVINLPFKTDRLESFQKSVPKILGEIEVWPAVHGDSIKHPDCWSSGNGSWGCLRSHLQILEHAYQYQDEIESYLVLEDDAIFRPDFDELFPQVMEELNQHEWEMCYFGGQILHESQHPPQKISQNLYRPYNVNRTHCFALHRRGYEKVYRHLMNLPYEDAFHIDHHLGRLHESGTLAVYCSGKWIVGQDSGSSNISGKHNSAEWWVDPEKYAVETRKWQSKPVPAVFLESPIHVAIELEREGWHRGHWQDHQHLDRGVCEALTSLDVKSGLVNWFRAVQPEASREGKKCICLYHPTLHLSCVQSLDCGPFHHIVAKTVEEARQKFAEIEAPPTVTTKPTRNLIYHIWPKSGNGKWQWNVQELLKRIDQFDGVRSVAIATDLMTDSVEDVKAAFGSHRIDNWLICPNDPKLGEVVTFRSLLQSLPKDDDSITFYGHAKGVKYDDPEYNKEWSRMMYEICLDDPTFVDASLSQYDCTGPFLNDHQKNKPFDATWHYSGNFFWFKNTPVFRSRWDDIKEWYFGVEMWIGRVLERAEAGCLFGNGVNHLWEDEQAANTRADLDRWVQEGNTRTRISEQ